MNSSSNFLFQNNYRIQYLKTLTYIQNIIIIWNYIEYNS